MTDHNNRLFVLSEADTGAIRQESLGDVEYTVVPVVALVEGVLHSSNAENPELALASEFGKITDAWNGRPLVMNHPKLNGAQVPAGNPSVWYDYMIGFIFNASVEDSKLKVEAWVDNAKVSALGGDAESTLARINAGEMVEVSTGLFAETIPSRGHYNGKIYEGIWNNILPDHLAFLSEGTIGACSVADGCGTPRLNEAPQMSKDNRGFFVNSEHKLMQSTAPKTNGCGCSSESSTCTCTNVPEQVAQNLTPQNLNTNAAELASLNRFKETFNNMFDNSAPDGMEFGVIKTLLTHALKESLEEDFWSIHSINTSQVTYERWSSSTIYRRSFTINSDNSVTLGSDEHEVLMIAQIINKPEVTENPMPNNPTTNNAGESTAPAAEALDADGNPIITEEQVTEEEQVAAPEAAAPVSEVVANATPKTLEQYIADAPVEMREVLSEGIKMQRAKRAEMTKEILESPSNKFNQASLDGMDMETLSGIHALAAAPTISDYSGAAPRQNSSEEEELNYTPAPGDMFARINKDGSTTQ